jgi:hypothetical protein
VLAHRILAKNFRQGGDRDTADTLVDNIVGQTQVPA